MHKDALSQKSRKQLGSIAKYLAVSAKEAMGLSHGGRVGKQSDDKPERVCLGKGDGASTCDEVGGTILEGKPTAEASEALDSLRHENTMLKSRVDADEAKVRSSDRQVETYRALYTKMNSDALDESNKILTVCDMLHADINELCDRHFVSKRTKRDLRELKENIDALRKHVEEQQRENPLFESIERTTTLDTEDVRRAIAARKALELELENQTQRVGDEDASGSAVGGLAQARSAAKEKAESAKEWVSDNFGGTMANGVPILRRADGSTGDLGIPLPTEGGLTTERGDDEGLGNVAVSTTVAVVQTSDEAVSESPVADASQQDSGHDDANEE